MRKDLFIKSINNFKNYMHYEDMLANWGINIWEREEIQGLVSSYLELLAYCCKDEYDDGTRDYNDIDYFIYMQEFGNRAEEFCIEEEDGTKIINKTPEDLWNYLVKIHPEIDTGEVEKQKKETKCNLEELKAIFTDMIINV